MKLYFVHEGLVWLPPTVRGRCAELSRAAAERAAEYWLTDTGIYPLKSFGAKYWYARVSHGAIEDEPLPIPKEWRSESRADGCAMVPLSTEDIGILLRRGFCVFCVEGPFDTRGQVQYRLDLHSER